MIMENSEIPRNNENDKRVPPPNDYLAWAVLSLIFCCLPFGIVSLIHSIKVEDLWRQGFLQEAEDEAAKAKKWAKYAFFSGIAIVVGYVLLYVALIAVGALAGGLSL